MTEPHGWSAEFTARAARRTAAPEPDWTHASRLHPAVVRSVQKFQVGESGDGAHLIANAATVGDRDYETAIRLFVAEEQNHARMLAGILRSAGAPTKRAHWSDTVFVHLRRLLGLKLELMVLAIAEIVALRYYRALADGGNDELLTDVSERILDDERHHVPFQCRRLNVAFDGMRAPARILVKHAWRTLALGVVVVVAVDHGSALRACGVTRRTFVVDTMQLFDDAAASVFDGVPMRV
ncbi:ferritin-like domain-containing protein [Gordonia sp. SL306]|uniref:ferritin-like domain-containing protein n=1 Tax=Gordonia sp. SL306 TaxID=2995145 RepID=UPI002271C60E|nr:ferritin-like domain-containing protein [Gordonia sp. SL306]WAC55533.1 ferritin-like domain-containing protein [Gordonia sp. SL306]